VVAVKSLAVKREPDFGRYLTALRRGEPAQVPFCELKLDPEVVEALLEEPLVPPDTPEDKALDAHWRNWIRCLASLGYDDVRVSCDIPLVRERTPSGDTAIYSRGDREWQPETEGPIRNWEDLERYPWPTPEKTDYTVLETAARHLPDGMKISASTHGGVLEWAMWLMGYVPFSLALYDDPGLVAEVFRRVGELMAAAAEAMAGLEYVGALFMGDDMGHKHGTLVAPQVIRDHALPWHKRIADAAHAAGKPYIFHSCGDLAEIMDDLIGYCGIDAKHSFEDTIIPVGEAKRQWGDRIAICGGVDMDKLARWPEYRLREYVRGILEECAPGGGYLLGSGNSVTNYVPVGNYLAMLDEGLRFSGG
jgi:uroporphyrinogen decarboxylase